MRQVPLEKPFFALVGQGRVGRALAAYLSAQQLPHRVFTRDSHLSEIISSKTQVRAVLLAVSDPAIAELGKLLRESGLPLIHFSGSVRLEGGYGFHPLYSFTERRLSPDEFARIPFLCDPGHASVFREIFPELGNPVFELKTPRDARYHALCVLLGNLPLLIQDRVARALQTDYAVPREACLPYLQSLLANFTSASEMPTVSVAGPIARRDVQTTAGHLKSVAFDPFLNDLYSLLLKETWPEYPRTEKENSP
jgi:2-dehydropantoate 2-reductase